ncbi:hypothetical protein [Leptolyngbya sp. 7M]|uniref:hypothetical protein n=1 Tax=Leptolyngbya sp. 7M TaxID=2812896 RepID=UPI001B8D3556|nr:hypothetical protein [Leptolyngbya sp. 7M]QYO64194.1 hypothetical protein JVX88_31365 [Leptolyngbya sp. 7M]
MASGRLSHLSPCQAIADWCQLLSSSKVEFVIDEDGQVKILLLKVANENDEKRGIRDTSYSGQSTQLGSETGTFLTWKTDPLVFGLYSTILSKGKDLLLNHWGQICNRLNWSGLTQNINWMNLGLCMISMDCFTVRNNVLEFIFQPNRELIKDAIGNIYGAGLNLYQLKF